MVSGRLQTAEDIELVNASFKNDNWKEAADEMIEFWNDGVDTYKEMGKRGEWSRAHYQNVFEEHFRMVRHGDNPAHSEHDRALVEMSETYGIEKQKMLAIYQDLYSSIYRDGYRDGANWASGRREE